MTSRNCLTGTDRVAEISKKFNYKWILNIQGDEPLINIKDVKSYYFRFPPFKSYTNEFNFDFKMLPKFSDLCNTNHIISDLGSTIIFENNCTSLNN